MKKIYLALLSMIVVSIIFLGLVSCGDNPHSGENTTGTNVQLNGFKKIDDETIGTMYYISIPNSKMVYSLSDVVSVAENSTWTVSTDISGNKTIASKTLQLDEGDNLYYLQVRDEKSNVRQYILLIHRRFMYTVTYKSNGTVHSTENVEEGKYAAPPSITPPTGYTMGGWDYDFSTAVSKNLTINAILTPKQYTVTFNPNGGTLANQTQTVQYNAYINLPTPAREGYTFDGWYFNSKKCSSGFYDYDGNLELKAEWSAKKYTITYNLGGGTNSPDNDTYYYAFEPIVLINPTLPGYEFLGWTYDGETTPQKNLVIYDTYGNKTFTANWEKIYDPDEPEVSNGLEYTAKGDKLIVTGIGTCTDKNIVIPYVYNGKRVTEIGDDAFSATEITSVIIPDSVTTIGERAFSCCLNLTSIDLPDSLTKIGFYTFGFCTSLSNVFIPKNVSNIDVEAFSDCKKLTSIIVDDSNNYYKSINGNLYTKDGTKLIQYALGKTEKSFTIPTTVSSIADYAFSSCQNIQTIIIPDTVTKIGSYAFLYCDNLQKIVIGSNVKTIGSYAFSGCSLLTIYCKQTKEPDSWNSDWNYNYWDGKEIKVVWNYKD